MPRNIIAPNTEEPAELLKLVSKWDYQKAVERIAPKIARWKGLTADIVRELYIAHKHLDGQKGQRKDPDSPDYIWFTWNDFCEAVGISRQTAAGFLRRFIPAELSKNGEDKLYTPEEWKLLNPPDAPLTTREEERLIARFMNTGERPPGWTNGLERIATERLDAQKNKKTMELFNGKFYFDTKRDYYADLRTMVGKNNRFRLKTQAQINAQNNMFLTIHDYFRCFEKLPDLMSAAANLTDKIHLVFNYFAELLVDQEETGEE